MFQNRRRCIAIASVATVGTVATIPTIAVLAVIAGCSSDSSVLFGSGDPSDNGGNGGDSGDPDSRNENGGGGDGGHGANNQGGSGAGDGNGGSGPASCTGTDPDKDEDGDGYTPSQGDCNDCNPLVNPGAFDIPGNGIDDDCDGVIDNEVECDSGLAIDDADPDNGARALDLCRFTDDYATGAEKTWGVINGSARYVKADGTVGMNPIGHGLLPGFGAENIRRGQRMLALSSGAARAPGQPGYSSPLNTDHGTSCKAPEGYPKDVPYCPAVKIGPCNDPAALELRIRVPTNAHSFSFNLNIYFSDFPNYLCTAYTDFYVTMMWPQVPGLLDPNLTFDAMGSPITASSPLVQVCNPGTYHGKYVACAYGTAGLANTGFENYGATGWLITEAPVVPGSVITLRFAIWDSEDHLLDSTVLLDNFQWHADSVTAPTPTQVLPPPP
ncbi:MAG: putative metal-binding motif-containing protein [Polyangiaceae bacterium]|nr:putative metal-binding motif-containing protein [Polyangiaceae bacterium]